LQFYNTSKHTLETLKENPKTIEIDFNNYLNGFNKEVRDIIENFQFDKVIARLIKNKLLYQMIDAISEG
jgi:type I restriction enzyme M protein